jgi:Mrp family chromosome partitioning ATPase/LPS O-antigen subunit length determinant protein (WzzB/FepE family)
MTEERNHATLRDYLLTLRRRKFVILGIVLAAAAVAGALAFTEPKQYTAQASLQAQDLSQSAALAGIQQTQQNVPQATAAQLAQTATQPEVLQKVKRQLRLPDSIDAIRSKFTISQDQQSNFILMSAAAPTPGEAARLANSAVSAVAGVSNAAARAQFARIATRYSQQAASVLREFAGKNYGQLSSTDRARFQAVTGEANQLEQLAARVDAFSKAVTVAQVATVATPPSSPSSPHPVSNLILGAILGFVVSLLVVWFLESLDRRLRRPDEAETVLGLPVVGSVKKGALGQLPGHSNDAMPIAAFRMIRTNVRFLASGHDEADAAQPRSLLVTSPMSGEGKTTLSLGLALSAAASGLTTLLIEADVHRPVHAARLGLAPGPGLADYMRGGVSPGEVLQIYRFVDPALQHANGAAPNGNASQLTCITAGNVSSFQAASLGTERFAKMIAEVAQVYDFVVIDSAPLLAVAETSEMVAFVDSVVMCARLGSTTVEQARAARTALERLPKRPAGIVLTDLDHDASGYYGYAYEYASASAPAAKA